jgi:hypothetical protein
MLARRSTLALALASTALIGWPAAADTRVGVTSAVNPSAAGTPPGADARQLTVGSDIQFRERVITTTDGQAQILFLDQSSLLIGPNSTVVIDEFVYDPATNKGNIAATLTQGSFRYIGGKLSKQGNATLKTPVATLGIRGSDVTVGFDAPKKVMDVLTTHGSATVQTQNETVSLRSGFGLTVSGNGPVGQPTALTSQQIAAANGKFEGQPGKSGGAGKPPTDGEVAKSGLGGVVEAKQMSAIETGSGSQPAASTFSVPFTPSNNDTPVVFPPPPPPPPPPSTPQTISRTDRLMNGYMAGTGITATASATTYAITNDSADDVVIRTTADAQGTGRVFAKFVYRPAQPGPIGTASFELGDPSSNGPATQSTFIDDSTFVATQAASGSAGVAKVDGQNASVIAVLSSVPANAPVSTVTSEAGAGPACNCSYVTWGVWAATMQTSSGTSHSVPRGLWVAGVLPNITDPSPQGSATFNGTAIGVVDSQVSQRFASGAFTNNYNFTQRTGTVTITNFDGKTFGGTVAAASDWRSYGGALSGSGLNGSLNGSFYGNRTAGGQLQTPKETAGNFNVRGTGYTASGIFLGSR